MAVNFPLKPLKETRYSNFESSDLELAFTSRDSDIQPLPFNPNSEHYIDQDFQARERWLDHICDRTKFSLPRVRMFKNLYGFTMRNRIRDSEEHVIEQDSELGHNSRTRVWQQVTELDRRLRANYFFTDLLVTDDAHRLVREVVLLMKYTIFHRYRVYIASNLRFFDLSVSLDQRERWRRFHELFSEERQIRKGADTLSTYAITGDTLKMPMHKVYSKIALMLRVNNSTIIDTIDAFVKHYRCQGDGVDGEDPLVDTYELEDNVRNHKVVATKRILVNDLHILRRILEFSRSDMEIFYLVRVITVLLDLFFDVDAEEGLENRKEWMNSGECSNIFKEQCRYLRHESTRFHQGLGDFLHRQASAHAEWFQDHWNALHSKDPERRAQGQMLLEIYLPLSCCGL